MSRKEKLESGIQKTGTALVRAVEEIKVKDLSPGLYPVGHKRMN
jgi:hypothetical protein